MTFGARMQASVKINYVSNGDADHMLCGVSTPVSAKIKYVTHWDLSKINP